MGATERVSCRLATIEGLRLVGGCGIFLLRGCDGLTAHSQEYAAAERAWVLVNSDTNEEIVYPNDPKLKIKVDNDIQDLWNGIKVPTYA
eukprot:791770-Prorocentrum_minimum.AAC.3